MATYQGFSSSSSSSSSYHSNKACKDNAIATEHVNFKPQQHSIFERIDQLHCNHRVTMATKQVNMFNMSQLWTSLDKKLDYHGNTVRKDQHHANVIVIIIIIIILCYQSHWWSCRKEQSLDQILPTRQSAGGGAYLPLSTHKGGASVILTSSGQGKV